MCQKNLKALDANITRKFKYDVMRNTYFHSLMHKLKTHAPNSKWLVIILLCPYYGHLNALLHGKAGIPSLQPFHTYSWHQLNKKPKLLVLAG